MPYVMTRNGIVAKYHKFHLKRLEIPMNEEAYIQSMVLKKTVETISFDRRRGLDIFLKRGNKEEYGVKNSKKRKNTPLNSDGEAQEDEKAKYLKIAFQP
ncbi:hypothetical protein CWI37_0872p0010 [Hamiltosporidium tvaerminnensis]|uniref:Uncharacterized protein n=1 Tax=Hamiltosporidium tvaerminnensis TaxID=1176355 RepID=A0A4Q9L215_9MICR|nr:hypothetical protein CWI37_0872p0010 [Hamiltosporidium tvaerminnensis]